MYMVYGPNSEEEIQTFMDNKEIRGSRLEGVVRIEMTKAENKDKDLIALLIRLQKVHVHESANHYLIKSSNFRVR